MYTRQRTHVFSFSTPLAVIVNLLFVAAFVHGSGVRAQGKVEAQALTNADVIKMVQAHMSADAITEKIRNGPGYYSLSPKDLGQLKKRGVPDEVVAAMQAKRAATCASSSVPVDPVLYSDGFGAAMKGYLTRCHAGDAKGCELVGSGLEHGLGVDKNPQLAKAFFNQACCIGLDSSCSRLQ